MFSLDSSTLRLLYQGNVRVKQKVLSTPISEMALSAIVIHEVLGGRLANLRTAQSEKSSKAPDKIEKAYAELFETLELITLFPHLPYTKEDELAFLRLPAAVKRIGSQDCRIAVQAQRFGVTVVTQNLSDFEAIGVSCMDWSFDNDSGSN